VEVVTTKTPKQILSLMPVRERTFFLAISHISNELNVLQKIFYWASSTADEQDLLKKAHTTQSMTLAKVLAGKLSEAWSFCEKSFFASKLSAEWESLLQDDSRLALSRLKKYFGKKNLIVNIRNNFAFHYSAAHLEKGFEHVPDNEGWMIVLSDTVANSLYYAPELVANYAMLESIAPGDHPAAMEAIISEIMAVARDFIQFAGGCWILVRETYLLDKDGKLLVEQYLLDGCPNLSDVEIPFFIEPPNKAMESDA
jgi:hypothetical protein